MVIFCLKNMFVKFFQLFIYIFEFLLKFQIFFSKNKNLLKQKKNKDNYANIFFKPLMTVNIWVHNCSCVIFLKLSLQLSYKNYKNNIVEIW